MTPLDFLFYLLALAAGVLVIGAVLLVLVCLFFYLVGTGKR
jgi:hypothetical protein